MVTNGRATVKGALMRKATNRGLCTGRMSEARKSGFHAFERQQIVSARPGNGLGDGGRGGDGVERDEVGATRSQSFFGTPKIVF